MKKLLFIALMALSFAVYADSRKSDEFRMVIKGRPQVQLARMSYDQTITCALDEFIAYMNAVMKTTDYTGRAGLFTLNLAIAGNGSCELADETMARHGHSFKTLGREGFLLARTSERHFMLCSYSSRGVLNGVYKIFEKAFGVTATRPLAGLDFPERYPECKPIVIPLAVIGPSIVAKYLPVFLFCSFNFSKILFSSQNF